MKKSALTTLARDQGPWLSAHAWAWCVSAGLGLLGVWAALVMLLVVARPKEMSAREALRLLPDALRLLRRLAVDETLPATVRARLGLLLAYLALPFDLIPDFVPVIGQLDDVIIAILVLRSVVRSAGPAAICRHWPGTPAGLTALWKLAGLPGQPPAPAHFPLSLGPDFSYFIARYACFEAPFDGCSWTARVRPR